MASTGNSSRRKLIAGTNLDETIPFIKPPAALRCKRNDGKEWRCNRWRIHNNTLCEFHYLRRLNNENKKKKERQKKKKTVNNAESKPLVGTARKEKAGKRGREDYEDEEEEEELEVISAKKQRGKSKPGEEFEVKLGNRGKKLGGEVDNLKEKKNVTVGPKVEEDEEVVSEEEKKKKRDNGSLVKKETKLANRGEKLDCKVDDLKKKKSVTVRPKVEKYEEVVSEEENKKKRDDGSLVEKETMLIKNEASEKGKEVELLDRTTRSKEKLKNLIKKEKELDDRVAEIIQNQLIGSGIKRKHDNTNRNAQRDPKQRMREKVGSCHQCWNSERKVVQCRKCKKKCYCSPCIKKW